MYLKTLFHQSKFWFAVVVVFILCQLFINLKKGMVFSPFYHYGMYSEVMKPQASYPIFGVVVDGEELKTKEFTPQQWDKIIQPLVYYSKHQSWNAEMFDHARRITGVSSYSYYNNRLTKNDFLAWYRLYLSELLDKDVMQVNIKHKTYQP
jgi:hypothetical protein